MSAGDASPIYTVRHDYEQKLADGRTVTIPKGTQCQRIENSGCEPGWYFNDRSDPPTLNEIVS